MASNAAPIAPASPACLCTMISGVLPEPWKRCADEIHLRLDRGKIVLGASLQDEARSQFRQIGDFGDVEPDIFGQYGRQPGQDFVRLPPLPLEAGDVRLQKDGAAVREDGHLARRKCDLRKLLDFESEAFGDCLQEVAVSGGALGIQLEILDPPVFQNDQLDVLPAHIDDGIRALVVVQRGFGMRDGFDQGNVGADDVPQRVLGIPGGCRSQHLDPRALRFDLAAQLFEDLDRVLDRIAFGKLIGPGQDFAVQREKHGLGGGGSAVDADEASRGVSRVEFGRHERRRRIGLQKGLTSSSDPTSAGMPRPPLLRPSARPCVQILELRRSADTGRPPSLLLCRIPRRPARRSIPHPGALGSNLPGVLPSGICTPRSSHISAMLCCQASRMPGMKAFGTAQQQNVRKQRVAAGQHLQILEHEGFEQRSHQFFGRDSLLLQAVDIGFGKYAAFAGDRVQADSGIAQLAQVFERNPQLGADFVDDGAGAAGALVVHGRDFFDAAGLGIFSQDDDLWRPARRFRRRKRLRDRAAPP